MKKIILIDGNGLIFRAFYATYMRMSVNHTGVPTNAIYLFSSILIKLLEKHDFDDILVALDSPGKKFRHQEFQDYMFLSAYFLLPGQSLSEGIPYVPADCFLQR